MKSEKEIGVPGERGNLPQAGAGLVPDRPFEPLAGATALRRSFECFSAPARLARILFPLISLFCASVLVISGCNSALRSKLGPISVTNPSGTPPGQVKSVVVNASVNVSVAVSNDGANLGVDWSLLCQGSPIATYTTNVCGTITPVHVGSNINMVYLAPAYVPIASTVTLTATATSDPALSASVTLTILPPPVTIQFTEGYLPPATIAASETATLAATVSNDPTAAGAKWSVTCGSSSCGSFDPTETASGLQSTVYKAPAVIPAGGTVKVTAASAYDPSTSVSATIAILPVEVSVSPQKVTVPARSSTSLTATVVNDAFNAGVEWKGPVCEATGAACGTISAMKSASGDAITYTAPTAIPPGGGVKVTAVSVTDPTATATVDITIGPLPPITVSVAASPSSVQAGYRTEVTATVNNDYTNQGVSWSCNPGSCSAITSTGEPPYTTTYLAPDTVSSLEKATVIATSIADPKKSGSTIVEVYPSISVKLNLPTQAITAGKPVTFSATVINDIAPGGVDWTATCPFTNPPCGTFNSGNKNAPAHSASGANITYIPPQEAPWPANQPAVIMTATSTASETVGPVQSNSGAVPVTPVPYPLFVPFAPSSLPLGNSSASLPALVSLIAVVADDPSNAGLDWTLSCSDGSAVACGQFLETPELVAPATSAGALPVPPKFWPYGTKIHVPSGQSLSYEPPTQMPTGSTVRFAVTSTANPSASATQVVNIANDTTGFSGVALNGTVKTGDLPVSGASVELFVAGNTGYGSAATPMVISNGATSVTTASDGSFTIPAGYACPSAYSLLYLVATGGTPQGVGSANAQLGLMTALGPCGNLNDSVSLTVNEVTTVASVFALAPFTGADYTQIGSSSTNYNNGPNPSNATNYNNGFANAFSTVNNLVNITTGQAYSITPAGNGTAPQAEINTLADAIDTCAATAGGLPGDGSPCSAYFEASNVNPPGGGVSTPGNAPTTILQAVLEVAQVPSSDRIISVSTEFSGTPLYILVPSPPLVPPFMPILMSAPYDWSISLSFSGGGLEGTGGAGANASAMALDVSGNVWVADREISSVTELSNLGAALSPFTTGTKLASAGGFKGGGVLAPRDIAVDPYGNVWVLNSGSTLSELNSAGIPLTSAAHTFSGAGNPANIGVGLAIDGTGNAWVADSGSSGDVAEYAGYNGGMLDGTQVGNGTPLSPKGTGYSIQPINLSGLTLVPPDPSGPIAVDGSGDVWILDGANLVATKLGSTGAVLDSDAGDRFNSQTGQASNPPSYILGVGDFGVSMAIDNAGDLWIPNNNSGSLAIIYELLAGESSVNFGGTGQTINPPIYEVFPPIAIDGSGHQWLTVRPNVNSSPVEPMALAELTSSGAILNYNLSAQGFVASSINSRGPTKLAVDASGNVWILSGLSPSTLTEFVGVAAPVPTPFSVAVQEKKLGKTP